MESGTAHSYGQWNIRISLVCEMLLSYKNETMIALSEEPWPSVFMALFMLAVIVYLPAVLNRLEPTETEKQTPDLKKEQ